MGDFIHRETVGKVAVLTINRPGSLNAIGTLEDCDDFVRAVEALGADRGISAFVLTGSGRAFSAGGNLKAMQERTGIGPGAQPGDTRDTYRRGVQRVVRALMETEVPAIAAVNGHAVGLGCDLACLCDIRLAAASAQFSCSFIKVGLVPGDGGAWSLARIVGYSMAAELFLTGDRFDAARAKEIGLVGRVVPDAELLAEAMVLADRIAANPARALRLTKRLLREAQTARMSEILELSAAYQALAHGDRRPQGSGCGLPRKEAAAVHRGLNCRPNPAAGAPAAGRPVSATGRQVSPARAPASPKSQSLRP